MGKEEWKEIFGDIFGGYVSQENFLDAAESMAFVSEQKYQDHLDFLNAFEEAIKAADRGDQDVISLIESSTGYGANSFKEAKRLIIRLRDLYLDAYKRECD